MRALLLVFALTAAAAPALGQATPIQPCEAAPAPASAVKIDVRSDRSLVDGSIPDDPAVEKMLAPYSGKVRALNVVIGTLEGPLTKEGVGAGTLGNFVTDGVMAYAKTKLNKPIALTIMNSGGLRKNEIAAGQLRATDIFELLPFENALVAVEVTGAQLSQLLQIVLRDAQAGARIHFKYNDQGRTEFISGKLVGAGGREQEIDPEKIYTIVTIDYLLRLGGGPYAILQEARSSTPLNVTLRDAIMEYVKTETAAGRRLDVRVDDRFVQHGPGPRND